MNVTGVVMAMMLFSADGTVSQGVVPYDSYESCWRSLRRSVDIKQYPVSVRVCMDANLYDAVKSATK
jgi:hypothetical protein